MKFAALSQKKVAKIFKRGAFFVVVCLFTCLVSISLSRSSSLCIPLLLQVYVCELCKCVNALAALHYVTLAQRLYSSPSLQFWLSPSLSLCPLPAPSCLQMKSVRWLHLCVRVCVCWGLCVCACVCTKISLSISAAWLLFLASPSLLSASLSLSLSHPSALLFSLYYSRCRCLFPSLWLRSNPFDSLANCCAIPQRRRYTWPTTNSHTHTLLSLSLSLFLPVPVCLACAQRWEISAKSADAAFKNFNGFGCTFHFFSWSRGKAKPFGCDVWNLIGQIREMNII